VFRNVSPANFSKSPPGIRIDPPRIAKRQQCFIVCKKHAFLGIA
jgi:hypothetical protein